MADSVPVAMLLLHITNLAASAYALYLLYSMQKASAGSFSKTVRIMFLALTVFSAFELVLIFRLAPDVQSEFVQSFFTLLFQALLLLALHEVKKGMLAHEHLMRRKHKQRLIDVE